VFAQWHVPDSSPTYCIDPVTGSSTPCTTQSTYVPVGEDGNYEIDKASYSFISQANGTLAFQDSVTGLLWLTGVPSVGSVNDAETACCNQGTSWRVPTIIELASLFDFGHSPPFYPNGNNVDGGSPKYWAIENSLTNFSTGDVYLPPDAGMVSLLCVQDAFGSTSGPVVPTFTANGSGTLYTDSNTHLTWYTGLSNADDWQSALDTCNNLNATGICDQWRLPSYKELLTLLAADVSLPPSNTFPSHLNGKYWSSTPEPSQTQYPILGVNFAQDTSIHLPLIISSGNGAGVLCVSGP
jgi:hypothetical protein